MATLSLSHYQTFGVTLWQPELCHTTRLLVWGCGSPNSATLPVFSRQDLTRLHHRDKRLQSRLHHRDKRLQWRGRGCASPGISVWQCGINVTSWHSGEGWCRILARGCSAVPRAANSYSFKLCPPPVIHPEALAMLGQQGHNHGQNARKVNKNAIFNKQYITMVTFSAPFLSGKQINVH